MAITAVASQEGGTSAAATSVSRAFPGNVTSGNFIIVVGARFSEDTDDFVSGDCTKSAGTATVGAITLQKLVVRNLGGTTNMQIGIWSCAVTGTGSCTMQVGTGTTDSAHNIATGEYTSDVGAIELDSGQTNSNQAASGAPDSGSVTTTRNGIIVGGVTVSGSGTITITPDGSFTEIDEEQNGNSFLCYSAIRRIVTGSTADSASWTAPTANEWAAAVVAFVEPASGSSSVSPSVSLSASASVSPSSSVSASASPSGAGLVTVGRSVLSYDEYECE